MSTNTPIRESLRQALVAAPTLPPGAEPSYQLDASANAMLHLETDPAKAEQRAQELSADLKTIAPVESLPP